MIINHSLIYLLVKIANAGLGFYTTVYLTSYLEPNEYGEYSQIISLTLMIGAVFYLPITASVTRFYQQKNDKHEFLKVISFLYLISSTVVVISSWIIYIILNDSDGIFTVTLLLLLKGLHDLSLEINRASLKPIRYGMQSTFQSIIFVVFLHYNVDIEKNTVLHLLIITYFSSVVVFYRVKKIKTFNTQHLYESINYGKTLIPVYFVGFLFQLIDRQIIAYLSSSENLAYYQVVSMLSQSLLLLVISSVAMSCYPLLVKNYGLNTFDKINAQVFYVIIGISIPAVFGFIAVTEDIILIFFGQIYFDAVKDIIWIVPISVFNLGMAANYFDFSFKLTNKNLKQIRIYIIPIAVVLIGNFTFISSFGLKASALSFFIASVIMIISTIYEGRKYLKLFVDVNYTVIVTFASFIMYASIIQLNINELWLNMALKIILGGVIYALLVGVYIWRKFR
ncbi:oligosaccharide flippase family protein [Vibrio cyclitrophicus]